MKTTWRTSTPRALLTSIVFASMSAYPALWQHSVLAQEIDDPRVDTIWDEIVRIAGPLENLTAADSEAEMHATLGRVVIDCQTAFRPIYTFDNSHAAVRQFVAQFGTRDAAADLAWALADLNTTVGVKGPYDAKFAKERSQQNLMARCQVELFISRPDLLDRYVRLVLWSGRFESSWILPRANGIVNDITRRDDLYWWHIRDLMLLMNLVGKEEFLRSVDVENIDIATANWTEWIVAGRQYTLQWDGRRMRYYSDWKSLFPDQRIVKSGLANFPSPETPFADWPHARFVDGELVRSFY